jgi:hypothetical protein
MSPSHRVTATGETHSPGAPRVFHQGEIVVRCLPVIRLDASLLSKKVSMSAMDPESSAISTRSSRPSRVLEC